MKKLVDGELVDMTAEEIAAREAEEQSNFEKQKKSHLAAYRYKKVNGGIVVSGAHVQTDTEARANILGAVSLGASINWKTKSGFVTLTAQQISDIATAIGQHVQKCFDAEKNVLENIDSYDTLQAIETAFDNAYSQ